MKYFQSADYQCKSKGELEPLSDKCAVLMEVIQQSSIEDLTAVSVASQRWGEINISNLNQWRKISWEAVIQVW